MSRVLTASWHRSTGQQQNSTILCTGSTAGRAWRPCSMADFSPRAVSLRALLPDAQFFGAGDLEASSCTCDSRTVQPGDVFVACVGTLVDGHDYIEEALERGAVGVVSERHVLTDGRPLCVVENSAEALGLL